jgi:hypothetical protein
VGTIERGPNPWLSVGENPARRTAAEFERMSETLSIGFHADVALVREPFAGLPLVQLEFFAELRWVISAEQPT